MRDGYLHGYHAQEQRRLYSQARTLEQSVFRSVEYPTDAKILEIGCGVGAQTELLLERFPSIGLTSLDRSAPQIERARSHYERHRFRERVVFQVGDALHLPFEDHSFDGSFLCWVLEHLADPLRALQELRRCLKPGAIVHLNEVFNQLHYVYPESPAILRYWEEYNRLQAEGGGNPFVGLQLGNLLRQAGFKSVTAKTHSEYWDNADARGRKWMIQYWTDLLMSAGPGLLEAGRVTAELIEEVRVDLGKTARSPEGILYFGWVKASAVA